MAKERPAAQIFACCVKQGPQHLPLTKEDNSGLPLIPLIGNVATFLAFLLARTQGPFDVLLHDLWVRHRGAVLVTFIMIMRTVIVMLELMMKMIIKSAC